MSEIKAGDRVKVEYTGVVREVETGTYAGKRIVRLTRDADHFPVAVILDYVTVIEPEYEEGAMYQDDFGDFYAYWPDVDSDSFWFEPGSGHGLSNDVPARPLRKLVPEESA